MNPEVQVLSSIKVKNGTLIMRNISGGYYTMLSMTIKEIPNPDLVKLIWQLKKDGFLTRTDYRYTDRLQEESRRYYCAYYTISQKGQELLKELGI